MRRMRSFDDGSIIAKIIVERKLHRPRKYGSNRRMDTDALWEGAR